MAESSHNRIIKSIARDTLRPLGLVQQGRSRTWFDDHGWWVTVVAFEPSGFGKAARLTLAAMWLWHDEQPGSVSFDLGRSQSWAMPDRPASASYESDAQFEPEMRRMAMIAAAEVEQYRAWIRTYEDCAAACEASEDVLRAFDAGVAWALAGKKRKALAALDKHDELMRGYITRDEGADWYSERSRAHDETQLLGSESLRSILDEPERVAEVVGGRIAANRAALRLPPLELSPAVER